jgi:hypothetical protein
MKKLDKKQFLLITVVWFFIAYFLLWFFGGACLNLFVAPVEVSSTCVSINVLSGLRNIPIIGLFIPYQAWVSLFYWFAPIAGFAFAFFGIKWWNNYFDTKEASSIFFVIIMLIFLLFGTYLTVSWYYFDFVSRPRQGVHYGLNICFNNDSASCNELTQNINQELIAQYQRNPSGNINQLIPIDYWSKLRENILLTFILGMIAAWVPFFVKDVFDKK